ncbi:hypothetical protein E1J29_03740 [Xanthomonas hortorum pv. vitians]|nr:hypothetical protein [Xanthomonas hortorum pv. vitians]NMI51951.1 hypothetical protein [Xanthomonas hortorum pv. taraxaci]PPU43582.1 hypothetical protein XcyCFBP4188_10810 [Xanthomonas hortorum pv. cynarae]QEW14402.1 hypothetical protein DYQ48_04730 [Xanthomonas hortorum]NMI24852.1 hypothetical protein [Xanthomonas hortorum pv. vitians]
MGPYAAWMPRKSLHGRTCGVSHAGTRASALSDRGICTKPADVVRGIGRCGAALPLFAAADRHAMHS